MRHLSISRSKVIPRKLSAKAIKRVCTKSIAKIKKKPLKSFGVFTLGAGLLSGIYMLTKWTKH